MRRNTIRSKLLLTYSLIILVAFFAIAILYSAIQVPELKSQTYAGLSQNAAAITASMDNELNQMSTVALNIAYSTLVKDRFFKASAAPSQEYSISSDAKILSDLLATLIFPNRPVDQINLYSNSHDVVASGLHSGVYLGDADQQPWYTTVVNTANHQSFQYSGTDPQISKYFTGPYGKQFVTFVMQNYDNLNNPYGFIEIKQRLSRVVSAATNYSSVYGEQVYIFDGNGALLFPLDAKPNIALFEYAKKLGYPQDVTDWFASTNKEQFICSLSKKSDFCTVMIISEQKLLEPVRDFIGNIALVTIIALTIALAFAYFASQSLTAPIAQLCTQIFSINISRPAPLPPLDTKLVELTTLHHTFTQMQEKLTESVNKQLMLQTQEMQSRMLALQSQMNPHFLFNSLAAIQAMADEGMDDEIAVMCQSMSNILRYISSSTEQQVPLADELHYTKDFLLCMAIRYQGNLAYTLNIPDEMLAIQVPKLCVQLLVENAIKFTSTKRPPYNLDISGFADETHYELSIGDNGPGFSQESLSLLRERIAQINETGLLPSLEINGMGLLNVYIRYRLLPWSPPYIPRGK